MSSAAGLKVIYLKEIIMPKSKSQIGSLSRLKKQKIPFTQIQNELLYRSDIDFSLKGLFAYIQSKPDGWEFSSYRIAKETKESQTTIKRMLRKLIVLGYIIRHKQQSGKITYQTVLFPKVPKCHGADLAPLSNTDNLSNTDIIESRIFKAFKEHHDSIFDSPVKWTVTGIKKGYTLDITSDKLKGLLRIFFDTNPTPCKDYDVFVEWALRQ